ncbi:hypothetical protein GOODEAATRI_028901 [Goodea atripinnis]|uniref:Uncharacterized protein n=1 Tax=Goodea atripinnis TaxID=208336 RepID=A0ABV0NEG5_9TELE
MLTSYAAPCDVRGCTHATLSGSACVYPSPRGVGNPLNPTRDRDWGLQLFPMNEEFPSVTALAERREDDQTGLSRGSKSRNKVSVGEPAEGSLTGCTGPVPWAPSSGRSCGRDCAADDSERAEAGALLCWGASPRRTPAGGSVGLRGLGVEEPLWRRVSTRPWMESRRHPPPPPTPNPPPLPYTLLGYPARTVSVSTRPRAPPSRPPRTDRPLYPGRPLCANGYPTLPSPSEWAWGVQCILPRRGNFLHSSPHPCLRAAPGSSRGYACLRVALPSIGRFPYAAGAATGGLDRLHPPKCRPNREAAARRMGLCSGPHLRRLLASYPRSLPPPLPPLFLQLTPIPGAGWLVGMVVAVWGGAPSPSSPACAGAAAGGLCLCAARVTCASGLRRRRANGGPAGWLGRLHGRALRRVRVPGLFRARREPPPEREEPRKGRTPLTSGCGVFFSPHLI